MISLHFILGQLLILNPTQHMHACMHTHIQTHTPGALNSLYRVSRYLTVSIFTCVHFLIATVGNTEVTNCDGYTSSCYCHLSCHIYVCVCVCILNICIFKYWHINRKLTKEQNYSYANMVKKDKNSHVMTTAFTEKFSAVWPPTRQAIHYLNARSMMK